jgi:glyoxylase-like metal-dependent hydrolase (beta-lactamase superfamily II)
MTDLLPTVMERRIGRLRTWALQTGGMKLDGGAMFGVVPKPLWERRIPADERNRIQLGMRCLLIEHDTGLVLIDTGAGNKEDAKFHDIYGIVNSDRGGRTLLEAALSTLGVTPDDVRLVIDTHLHFDHAGGNTWIDADGVVRPTFPKARYVVQEREYEFAVHTNERTAASYFPRNFEAVRAAGLFEFVMGRVEILPGIHLIPTPGHVPHHQSVLIESAGERGFYAADLIPTSAHISLPWIMGYDVEPLVTLETKRMILERAVSEEWLIVFEHDARVPWGRAVTDGKSYRLSATD